MKRLMTLFCIASGWRSPRFQSPLNPNDSRVFQAVEFFLPDIERVPSVRGTPSGAAPKREVGSFERAYSRPIERRQRTSSFCR